MPESPLEEEGEARADRNRNDDDTDDFFTLEGYKNEEERSGPETSAFLQFSDEETSTDGKTGEEVGSAWGGGPCRRAGEEGVIMLLSCLHRQFVSR